MMIDRIRYKATLIKSSCGLTFRPVMLSLSKPVITFWVEEVDVGIPTPEYQPSCVDEEVQCVLFNHDKCCCFAVPSRTYTIPT